MATARGECTAAARGTAKPLQQLLLAAEWDESESGRTRARLWRVCVWAVLLHSVGGDVLAAANENNLSANLLISSTGNVFVRAFPSSVHKRKNGSFPRTIASADQPK